MFLFRFGYGVKTNFCDISNLELFIALGDLDLQKPFSKFLFYLYLVLFYYFILNEVMHSFIVDNNSYAYTLKSC